jgi:nanoRNase/pAp phosphatase (c-di-AMP/oligoRNAs hydrolase)
MKTNPNDKIFALETAEGLTKREYFAIKSMQAIIQHHGLPDGWTDEDIRTQLKSTTMAAVACADALMTELTKTEAK